ncbi:MAG: dual specificity protein phosphatase family protein [Deltaproteobacteria bacterium]|nr:dual specificity protein phosphatase family protein [Deltaproteobacteria bacterium]
MTGTLALGGRIPCERIHELPLLGITAVVDLRGETCDDEAMLARHGLEFLHLPTRDLGPVSPAMLREGVAFVGAALAERRRVLVHCEHGIGRSALLALCVLVDRGHAPLAALELAKTRRGVVSPSPEQYEAWVAWMRDHVRPHPIPTFEQFAAIAYRHLGARAALGHQGSR